LSDRLKAFLEGLIEEALINMAHSSLVAEKASFPCLFAIKQK
jgi:hypothetical protein